MFFFKLSVPATKFKKQKGLVYFSPNYCLKNLKNKKQKKKQKQKQKKKEKRKRKEKKKEKVHEYHKFGTIS